MIDIKDKILVMQSFAEGKSVQFRLHQDFEDGGDYWNAVLEPSWNWELYDYRVKPISKTTIIPFKNGDEFAMAQHLHGLYVKHGKERFIPISYNDKYVILKSKHSEACFEYENLIDFTFEDGTQCGITYQS